MLGIRDDVKVHFKVKTSLFETLSLRKVTLRKTKRNKKIPLILCSSLSLNSLDQS